MPEKTKLPPPSSTIGSALDVVLVADLADDLLDEILQRHQPGRAAVLVVHEGNLDLPPLELLEQRRDAPRLRHHVRGAAAAG